jgi:hypothetical protein
MTSLLNMSENEIIANESVQQTSGYKIYDRNLEALCQSSSRHPLN